MPPRTRPTGGAFLLVRDLADRARAGRGGSGRARVQHRRSPLRAGQGPSSRVRVPRRRPIAPPRGRCSRRGVALWFRTCRRRARSRSPRSTPWPSGASAPPGRAPAVTWPLLATLALGGIAALDATPVAQTLLSQPLVTATILGLSVGRPGALALQVGIVLQILAASTLPVGARTPEDYAIGRRRRRGHSRWRSRAQQPFALARDACAFAGVLAGLVAATAGVPLHQMAAAPQRRPEPLVRGARSARGTSARSARRTRAAVVSGVRGRCSVTAPFVWRWDVWGLRGAGRATIRSGSRARGRSPSRCGSGSGSPSSSTPSCSGGSCGPRVFGAALLAAWLVLMVGSALNGARLSSRRPRAHGAARVAAPGDVELRAPAGARLGVVARARARAAVSRPGASAASGSPSTPPTSTRSPRSPRWRSARSRASRSNARRATAVDARRRSRASRACSAPSLAALGDRLFWFTLRPFAACLGVAVRCSPARALGAAGVMADLQRCSTSRLRLRGVGWGYRAGPERAEPDAARARSSA